MIQVLDSFKDIIRTAEFIEYVCEEEVSRLKMKLQLKDSSYLSVREVKYRDSDLYSYFWLREDNTVIMGWDNAPHHREIETFPYHKHIDNRIESSEKMTLNDVLSVIKNYIT
ncbi:MAG TPA: DUF6516 family protein [Leptospiraceae bacterium]|nr:DUF6516 family protein [Leptospiraceae bacterium]